MFRSRLAQYLGLLLLVMACLGVIFFPIGARPELQTYTLRFSAPKAFDQLARDNKAAKGKDAVALVDDALNVAFPSGVDRVPTTGIVFAPGAKNAIVTDRATDREQAQNRAGRIAAAVSKALPGATFDAKSLQLADLPLKPIAEFGQYAISPSRLQNPDEGNKTAVKLGLDLRGGVSLVLQVRRALFPFRMNQSLTTAEQRDQFLQQARTTLTDSPANLNLRQADVNFAASDNRVLEVRTQAADVTEFNAQKAALPGILKNIKTAQFTPGEARFYNPDTGTKSNSFGPNTASERLDRTVEIVRARVDKLGVSEPLIQKQGTDRIVVQLPGVNDPQKAVEVIGTTAQMEIRLLSEGLLPTPDPSNANNTLFRRASNGEIISSAQARQAPNSTLLVAGQDVKPTTKVVFGQSGQAAVSFELQGAGSQKFADVTRQVQNPNNEPGKDRFIPIFLDERCISAPRVESAITTGEGQISGGFANVEEAQTLVSLLNSGALPAPIDVVENRTVSATLGTDSLLKSLRAGLIGLALVALFMIFYYRLPGLLANFALAVYCVLNLAIFILVGGTLTLPGIAGFLLAIAMSLDTNILVFERLKEEMAIQPTFTAALRAAFSRAWTAILDSHVTTLIAATVLFFLGTGPVKGFALTLGIGVLLSLFSAISVTRLFMWSVASTGERNRNLFGTPVARSEITTTK